MAELGEPGTVRATHRGAGLRVWTLAVLGAAVVLVVGMLAVFGGSLASSTVPSSPASRAATEVADSRYCSFLEPCSASAGTVHVDDIGRVELVPPGSPNPNACWYCYLHGETVSYTQWYVGVDYAHPVAVLKITDASMAQAQKPVLTLTAPELKAALAQGGYELNPTFRITDYVCVSSPCGPVAPELLPETMNTSMSGPAKAGETWEVVPMVAERAFALTDNSWNHLGEARSSGTQKVMVGLTQIVLH